MWTSKKKTITVTDLAVPLPDAHKTLEELARADYRSKRQEEEARLIASRREDQERWDRHGKLMQKEWRKLFGREFKPELLRGGELVDPNDRYMRFYYCGAEGINWRIVVDGWVDTEFVLFYAEKITSPGRNNANAEQEWECIRRPADLIENGIL